MPQAAFGSPASWSRKDARAEYLVRGTWDAVEQWYSAAFAGCGFHDIGSGFSGNRGGIVSQSLNFGFRDSSGGELTLVFEHAGSRHTLVLYAASAITPPPPQILVRVTPTAATVSYYRSSRLRSAPRAVISVTSETGIARLVRALNRLPVGDEPHSCPLDTGAHDTISLMDATGQKHSLDVSTGGCRMVRQGRAAVAYGTPTLQRLLATLDRGG